MRTVIAFIDLPLDFRNLNNATGSETGSESPGGSWSNKGDAQAEVNTCRNKRSTASTIEGLQAGDLLEATAVLCGSPVYVIRTPGPERKVGGRFDRLARERWVLHTAGVNVPMIYPDTGYPKPTAPRQEHPFRMPAVVRAGLR
jgi:hypothetical protein